MRRAAWVAVGAPCAVAAACSGDVVLAWPDVPGAVAWVSLATPAGSQATRAELSTPADARRIEAGDALEVLAFTAALDAPPGPLTAEALGPPLPAPAAAFRLVEGDDGWAWARAEVSPEARALRLPARSNTCPSYDTQTRRLDADSGSLGAVAMVTVAPDVLVVVAERRWFVLSAGSVSPLEPPVPGTRALAADPAGFYWLSAMGGLWRTSGLDLRVATATLARALPRGLNPFTLGVRDGAVFGLDADGRLFRADSATVAVIHRFAVGEGGTRGQVLVDGDTVYAGAGTDAAIVRLRGDAKEVLMLPTPSEGVVSLAPFAEYGLVVGTSQGQLRAESLGFEALPDPLDQMPRGVQIRALRAEGDRLFFGGNSGIFGEVTAERLICQSAVHASSGIRVILPFDGALLVAGLPFEVASSELNLTRFTVAP